MPHQELASKPGTVSEIGGTSGSTGERSGVATPIARSLPALNCSPAVSVSANITCTCPPTRSSSAGAPPLYGTCTMSMPVIILNISAAIWLALPMPADA